MKMPYLYKNNSIVDLSQFKFIEITKIDLNNYCIKLYSDSESCYTIDFFETEEKAQEALLNIYNTIKSYQS